MTWKRNVQQKENNILHQILYNILCYKESDEKNEEMDGHEIPKIICIVIMALKIYESGSVLHDCDSLEQRHTVHVSHTVA